MTTIQPTARSERIDVIDILRGLAIFGILIVNIHYFAHPWAAPALSADAGVMDHALHWVVQMFFTTKFFSLFSFLFGLGMALQMRRAEAKGVRFGPLYLRRLGILAVFGLAHATLLWVGDILLVYAVLGVLLFLFWRKAKPRTLLIWAVVLTGGLLVVYGLSLGAISFGRATPEGAVQIQAIVAEQVAAQQAEVSRDYAVYGSGTFAEVTAERARDYLTITGSSNLWIAPSIMTMFLLGLYAGKRRLFADLHAHLPFFRRVLFVTLPVGLALNLYWTLSGFEMATGSATLEPGFFFGMMALAVGGPALCLSLVSGVVLLSQRTNALSPFAAVGRMALTNYLTHSIVFTTLFYGYGFGLMNVDLSFSALIAMVIGVYALQIPFSLWWMKHFRFGPFEWLWRSLTYMRPQPLRRMPAPAAR